MKPRTLLGVFAHPDDESMGPGGTLARYAAEGHRVLLLTATDGGAGRCFEERPADDAGREHLKQVRRDETVAAVEILGIEHLGFLGWEDGALAARDVLRAEETIAAVIRREKADVVLTFHPSGISYHRDHRFMTHATIAAFLGAGRDHWYRDGAAAVLPPHAPSRLYAYVPYAGAPGWENWPREVYAAGDDEVTILLDTARYADTKWNAIQAHASQQYGPPFRDLYEAGAFRQEAWVRLWPTPPTGVSPETDLLDGLE